jgi:flagellar basal body P-ring formation protein FlgA
MKPAQLIIMAVLAFPSSLHAQSFEDITALDEQIAASLGAASGGSAMPIDRRLKLARCPQVPVIDPPVLGAIAIRCLPLGWRIRVAITPLKHDATQDNASIAASIAAPIVVQKGDAVELTISGDSFDVSASAIALDDGATGKSIRVKTLTSRNPVTAVVKGAGAVQISP